MRVHELVLAAVLMWAAVASTSPVGDKAEEAVPKLRNVDPISYKLRFTPGAKGTFSGHVEISMRCVNETDTLRVDARGDLSVSSTTLRCSEGDVPVVKTTQEDGHLVIVLGERLQPSHVYQLTIDYQGSGLLHGDHEGDWFVASNIAPGNASVVFPCFDDPTLKTPFELSVARRDPSIVVANMPLRISEPISGSDLVLDHFEATPPVSPCSVGFVVAVMHPVILIKPTTTKATIRLYGSVSVLPRMHILPTALEHQESGLRLSFPLPKLDVVALPDYEGPSATSSLGLIVIRESDLAAEHGQMSLLCQLTDQWLDHVVTPVESAADISSSLYSEMCRDLQQHLNVPEDTRLNSLAYSEYYELSSSKPFGRVPDARSWSLTNRGSWFMKMIHYAITEEKFMAGVGNLLEQRKFNTHTEHDLWSSISSQVPELEFSLEDIAHEWISRARYPVVTVTRDYDSNSAVVEQHMFLRERPHDDPNKDNLTWTIPIMYLTPDNMDLDTIRTSAWMKDKSVTITGLPASDKFIIVNPAEIGMFMVKYDAKNWEMLQAALERNVSSIPVDIRRKLFHDAWNLGYAGELNWATVMNMTRFLHKELDPSVWDNHYTMMDHVGRHIGGTSAGHKFKEYNQRLMAELVQRMGPVGKEDSDDRQRLAHMAYALSHPDTKPESFEQTTRPAFRKWMESDNPDAEVPDIDLCEVAEWGSMEELDFALQRLSSPTQNWGERNKGRCVKMITVCPNEAAKIRRVLEFILNDTSGHMSDQEVRIVFIQLTSEYVGWSTLFTFLEQNWDAVHARFESKPELWKTLVSCATIRFKTQDWYDKVSQLYQQHQDDFGVAKPTIESVLKKMREEVQWSNENLPVLEAWLDHELTKENLTR